MRKSFAALVFAALALAQPAASITFPELTTIYVGTGVRDSGGGPDVGIATAFQCSNVSGATAEVRFLVLDRDGTVEGSVTRGSAARQHDRRVNTVPFYSTKTRYCRRALQSPGEPSISN